MDSVVHVGINVVSDFIIAGTEVVIVAKDVQVEIVAKNVNLDEQLVQVHVLNLDVNLLPFFADSLVVVTHVAIITAEIEKDNPVGVYLAVD